MPEKTILEELRKDRENDASHRHQADGKYVADAILALAEQVQLLRRVIDAKGRPAIGE